MRGERIGPWTLLYVAAIPATNWMFGYVGVQAIPGTDQVWHPLAVLVGLWLVLRDFAHQELGDRWIMAPIAVGMALSYALASPRIATASAIAFAASELVDYAVFRWTRRPLSTRIMLSSAASVPIDSALFYVIAFGWSALNSLSLGVMITAKMAGAVVAAAMLRSRGA